jgi:starch phosphorylase
MHFHTFLIFPKVPEKLVFLEVLARNLWWCWHRDAIGLFRRIHPRLWGEVGGNPIKFATRLTQERLEELAEDQSFLAHLEQVKSLFQEQVLAHHAYVENSESPYGQSEAIAYFSMEFGIHESLPIYAGGLGILAGDHLKASADKGLPLVAVGLLYQYGYFRQVLDQNGWQHEKYQETDFYFLPMHRARDKNGKKVSISVAGPEGDIHAAVWKIYVGSVTLFLLDTNLSRNPPAIREITSRLYAGDGKLRLAQEVLLGIGGMRALNALNIFPKICHMNEGHCSFVNLERLVRIMSEYQADLKTAMEIVACSTVFTTHTPVAAGHDEFPGELVRPYLYSFETTLGVTCDEILSWGQLKGHGADAPLSMFILGMKMAKYINGVSALHGQVARDMWKDIWPGRTEKQIPITHITNGVHLPSWLSANIIQLLERYLGPEWYLQSSDPDIVKRIDDIYDEELWSAHEMNRSRLIRTCRELVTKSNRVQEMRRNATSSVLSDIETVLNQDVMTIGFARRFATYKRAYLLFNDPERLMRLLTSETHPVQFIFAGKAHPMDDEGKKMIQTVVRFAKQEGVQDKLIFIEDYDIHLGRHLIQGADIWLNTPRRPLEACGTSGMKAAANGVLNVSILDGWWCEGYSPETGWRIGSEEQHPDHAHQDALDCQALFNVLENEVIPCFYSRKNGADSWVWLKMMKASMKMAFQSFSSLAMVSQYQQRFYLPACQRFDALVKNDAAEARQLAAQRVRLHTHWDAIRIQAPIKNTKGPFRVEDDFQVSVNLYLGKLLPEEVDVELYCGNVKTVEKLENSRTMPMAVAEDKGNGNYHYTGQIACDLAGRFGFTVIVTPRGDDLIKFTPGLIKWAEN